MRWAGLILAIVSALAAPAPLAAQTYPSRPVQVIVPFTAGNVIDIIARAFVQELSAELKQPITINNIGGASGVLAFNAAAAAPADGYTLVFAPQGQLTIQPHINRNLNYKFETFKPVCHLFENVFAFIVAPNSPIRTFQDILDRARAKPGALTWATSGINTVSDLQVKDLFGKLGLKLVHVTYRNYGQMIQDAAGGNVDFAVSSLGSFSMDTVRMVALLADKRSPLAPDLVTVSELGYAASLPGFGGLFAPAAAPPEAVDRLAATCRTAFERPAVQEVMKRSGVTPYYLPGDKFAERLLLDSRQKAAQLQAMSPEDRDRR